MPKRINPSSKVGQAQIQQAQRQKRRPSAQPLAASSTSSRHGTTTSETGERRQVDQILQLTESEQEVIYEEQNTIVYAHTAMRLHLLNFTGVTLEPELDPTTGLVRSRDVYTILILMEEIKDNVTRLCRATYPEKEAMIDKFDTLPGRITSAGKTLKEWARSQRPDLYGEYIETAFVDFTRICAASEAGKERQREDTRGKMLKVMNDIRLDYNKHLPLRH